MMQQLFLNFREIIANEMKIRMSRTGTTYPFPYLITELCRAANMPKIVVFDDEVDS